MSKKYVIYTCNIGGYDHNNHMKSRIRGVDYVYFTDDIHCNSRYWSIRHVKYSDFPATDQHFLSRYIKFFPHLFFHEYEYSVYIDADILITSKLFYKRIDYLLDMDTELSIAVHKRRNCAYDEIERCRELGKDSDSNLDKAYNFLSSVNFPRNSGLYANCVIFRKHSSKKIQALMADWWLMLQEFSRRDQIMLPYLLHKHNISVVDFNDGEKMLRNKHWVLGCSKLDHTRKLSALQRWRNSIKKRLKKVGQLVG